ncbi:GGDEF domain-containing protein [Paraburkholderia phytofirmans]|jgi:diguanylate cyclase (GGDEF)-like protein|uniref:diguanylate cyclase domain-containing protein n=1 Tax=Paraburkholderia sp. BL9I2N2 TaxID=1938809 RepID=UPI001FB3BFE1|nr:GGDEF domain-containing protein [Paraburkholderia sp. BL9I2N2]
MTEEELRPLAYRFGFKSVNDALGHSAGDVLLCELGEALRAATRQQDMLAGVGGDEFVLLTTDCGDDEQLRQLAARMIARVREVGDKRYAGRFQIGVSIGIATYPTGPILSSSCSTSPMWRCMKPKRVVGRHTALERP